jgi:hypothetical protein
MTTTNNQGVLDIRLPPEMDILQELMVGES